VSVLLVTGGAALERDVFAREGRACWSAALPVALEKHGMLAETAGPEALDDPAVLAAHAAVLVGRQLPGTWTPARVAAARAAPGGVVVEGPLPAVVAEALGVRGVGTAAPEGSIQVTDGALRAAGLPFGATPGAHLSTGTSRPVALDDDQRWTALDVPISPAAAAAWRAPGWEAQRLDVVDPATVVLADWIPHDDDRDRRAAIVSRDGLVGLSVGLLSFLGQSHTTAPYAEAEHRGWPRTDGAEALLLGLIDLLHTRAGAVRARLRPWPDGTTWALHVRHDVDRTPKPAAVADTVARHAAAGTRATWYWRARHAGSAAGDRALRTVADAPGHEVALHTERLWSGAERERAAIEAVLGGPVAGSSAHGDPTCFRFQGAPNLLWAARHDLVYTELIDHGHVHPHRTALLRDDGTVALSPLLCLPHHASFERSMAEGDTLPEEVRAAADRIAAAGGLLQVLNHPDLNQDALFGLLASLPTEGRADLTALEAARWWDDTHTGGNVHLVPGPGGTVHVTADRPVDGLRIEVRTPDGELRERAVSVGPQQSVDLTSR